MNGEKKQFIFLFSFITVSLMTGFLGSQLSGAESVPVIYSELNQPSFSPPAWVFAPVWTILYLLMGISAYLIWKMRKKENVKFSLVFFFIQLVLNLLWPIIFFGLGQYCWAFIEIILLWVTILLTMKHFYAISKAAFYLLIPYIVWVTFAAFLNFKILTIN